MLYGGRMYTVRDKVIDTLASVLVMGMFIALWCVGAVLDLTTVGF